MKNSIKILYLYSEIMGYNLSTIKNLIKSGAEVFLVHWDKNKLANYKLIDIDGLNVYPRSEMSYRKLLKLASELNPDITVVSGWLDRDYTRIARYLKYQNKIVVCCFDNNYKMNLKTIILRIGVKLGIMSRFFSHFWIPGYPQFEYLKKIGINYSKIIYEMYSADNQLFDKIFSNTINIKKDQYPRNFIYLGRFAEEKGLHTLINAWSALGNEKNGWQLKVIGNGKLKYLFENFDDIKVKEFVQPENLEEEIKDAGCFILPSLKDNWGVVVHELAAAGLPLIISDGVGAKSTFLINGYNGYEFQRGNEKSLIKNMKKIINTSDESLYDMGLNSNKMSKRVSSETSSHQLLSLLEK